jgi:hypothetical protein
MYGNVKSRNADRDAGVGYNLPLHSILLTDPTDRLKRDLLKVQLGTRPGGSGNEDTVGEFNDEPQHEPEWGMHGLFLDILSSPRTHKQSNPFLWFISAQMRVRAAK